jgi:hypothetical protein
MQSLLLPAYVIPFGLRKNSSLHKPASRRFKQPRASHTPSKGCYGWCAITRSLFLLISRVRFTYIKALELAFAARGSTHICSMTLRMPPLSRRSRLYLLVRYLSVEARHCPFSRCAFPGVYLRVSSAIVRQSGGLSALIATPIPAFLPKLWPPYRVGYPTRLECSHSAR